MGMPIITPSNVSRCQAISDIIQSVALEQSALSHILNAEGEKIQKIVAVADTPEEMLSVNKSVNDVVNSITMLEVVLKSKLALFEDCICEECPCMDTSDTALSFIDLGDRTGEIIKNNMNSYSVSVEDCSDQPVSMLFAAIPAVPVKSISLPAGVTFENNVITIPGILENCGEVVLETGEGICRQAVIINICSDC